jgi:hypothetical protein
MYIPQSNIVETGYDQSFRFNISDSGQPYNGWFHKDTQNNYWSGEIHTESSFLLVDTRTTIATTVDNVLKNNQSTYKFTKKFTTNLDTPLFKGDLVIPTNDNYTKGYYTRYIVQLKASVQPYIVEINELNYNTLSNEPVVRDAYKVVQMLWKLTGPQFDVYDGNIRRISGVEDTNLRSLQMASKTIPLISTVFTNPLQFTRITK